jgi:hypothetical protein
MPTNTIPGLRLNKQNLADLCYSLASRAANLKNTSPKVSKRHWKLYDRLVTFLEANASKKGK